MPYPSGFRPQFPRPKKPSKGNNKPSSEHIHGRRKTWTSNGKIVDGKEVRSNKRVSTKSLYLPMKG